ncbi:capsule biosynthesis protein [Litoreibacter roseus]|uniref:Capsule polysaccharide transporter n=1 Tax=Litoreibacter roseus TaxID=2601869 RepID=A0A6N6JG15_9RHOB|nr:capsule biosynthesis protein [Litoreibacter roseus]GFE65074.1 capsule polysaccharide transporter [Litoreibacter roseus]
MTTKPKAKKFRIGRMVADGQSDKPTEAKEAQGKPAPNADDMLFGGPTDDGFGSQTFPTRKKGVAKSQPAETAADAKDAAAAMEAIRREGLTGRQLRMARRVAQKQGLNPTSDFDAVRLLREQGIDPFKRSNMLELVVTDGTKADEKAAAAPKTQSAPQPPKGGVQLPSKVNTEPPLPPSTHVVQDDGRARDIMNIQRDIARRRRRRSIMLAVRLMAFVMLPTIIAGYYYYAIATPMYATKSEFIIQQSEASGGSGFGGLLSGTGLATSQDSITVQGYLQSRDAMLRLDEDAGFREHFSQDGLDPLTQLAPDASNEDLYKAYAKRVRIGFDPTEGVIKMEVAAADPETSAEFSKKLIAYAEERVDQLTARLREDQMQGAEESRQDANAKMIAAQQRIVEIQERLGVMNPESEVEAVFTQIAQLESELLNERLALRTFLDNRRPNQARVSAAENKIGELERLIAEKRSELTQSSANTGSLARVSGELLVAQADLETRQSLLAQAEAQFEAARLEATRQVRYLSVGVTPVAPDEPTYPRAFENTALAFLIFSAIYLMVSLTASILREQV